jgi:thioredoxin-like negative regulator of GroEL
MTKRNDRPRRIGLGLTLACWLGAACATALALDNGSIPWRTDLHRAEIEARSQNRLLWVQFTGSWCPNCVRLERESFVHPQVVGHARTFFVPVKLQSEQHEDLVERFGLTGIPATILIKPSGEVLARHEGYVDAATFGTFLEQALIRSGRSPRPARSELTQTSTFQPGIGRARPSQADPKKAQRPSSETVRR